jgi:hypothetical protein
MSRGTFQLLLLFALLPAAGRGADGAQLSPERLDMLDARGYFTPKFKEAVHALIDAQQELVRVKAEEAKLHAQMPDLQRQAADLQVKLTALQKELALYEHPEDSDYDDLQNALKNPKVPPEERLAKAQAFVWSYPADPRQAEAEQDLRNLQKQIGDEQEAEKEAEAARKAAQAELIRRAQAHDLSLAEWQDFLRDMSQQDLLIYLGRPQGEGADFWTYTGAWTTDPLTKSKSGLQIHFNGTRVLAVTTVPTS